MKVFFPLCLLFVSCAPLSKNTATRREKTKDPSTASTLYAGPIVDRVVGSFSIDTTLKNREPLIPSSAH